MDYLEIKSVAKAVKEMCSSRGLNVSGIEWSAKLNENDDPVCVEASFRINGNHDVSEQADGIDDLVSKLETALSKYHPVAHITDADYDLIASRVVEGGYRSSSCYPTTTFVEIEKPEGVFYFDITSALCEVDRIEFEMMDENDDYLDTDFDLGVFYGFMEEAKARKAA
jgi:hypothetical protein